MRGRIPYVTVGYISHDFPNQAFLFLNCTFFSTVNPFLSLLPHFVLLSMFYFEIARIQQEKEGLETRLAVASQVLWA